jgi:ABC-type lipoprotein export system ATPase subunit
MSETQLSFSRAHAFSSPDVAAARAMALVEADGLGRVYVRGNARVVALASATCNVQQGARIAVVGPSGSGKSTLLHLLGGLDEPSSGTIAWPALGARARLRPAHVAYVFQAPSLLAALSVVENVELPQLLGELDATEARAAALDALARLDLSGLAERLPDELSGGQAQRVALARALAARPRLLLADEPTGQLDHVTAREVLDTLLQAIDRTPTALVVATHDQAVSARMETVWQMRHGTLAESGTC